MRDEHNCSNAPSKQLRARTAWPRRNDDAWWPCTLLLITGFPGSFVTLTPRVNLAESRHSVLDEAAQPLVDYCARSGGHAIVCASRLKSREQSSTRAVWISPRDPYRRTAVRGPRLRTILPPRAVRAVGAQCPESAVAHRSLSSREIG